MRGWNRSMRQTKKGHTRIRTAACILAALFLSAFPAPGVSATEARKGAGAEAGRDWQAVFTGESLESDFNEENFAQAAYELQPGESIVLSIVLKNEDTLSSDWYLSNEVLESLEDNSYAEGGAYTYILTYREADGTDRILYSSMTVGGEEDRAEPGRQGLHQAVEGLEDTFYLDRLEAGESGRLSLEIGLDGETQGNDYQNTLARLRLRFAVESGIEEDSRDSTSSKNTRTSKTSSREESTSSTDRESSEENERTVYRSDDVRTGDENRLFGWSAAAFVSAVLLLCLGRKKRKDRGEGNAPALRMVSYLILLYGLSVLGGKGIVQAESYEDAAYRADWSGSYTYRIVFHAGNQGTFAGTEHVDVLAAESGESRERPEIRLSRDRTAIVVEGLRRGDRVSFDAAAEGAVTLADGGRYYVQGIRLSGRDNDTVSVTSFEVSGERERDLDYVVAYGIRRDMTAYTIQYQDIYGNTLAASQTRYGSVGDRAMAVYRRLEGYEPQAYNMTKTLVKNEAFNVFTFIYTPVEPERAGENGESGENEISEETEVSEETEASDEPGETETSEESAAPSENVAAEEAAAPGTPPADEEAGPETEGPAELLELDDEGVPLADGGKSESGEEDGTEAENEDAGHSGMDLYFAWAAAAVCAAAVFTLLFLLLHIFRKRKKKDGEGQD